jgi:hypothetical protein
VDDRKYRQQGYRSASESSANREPRPTFSAARVPLTSRPVSRCAECGALLPASAASLSECSTCHAPLHACRQCGHFDPSRRFECSEAVTERIADKRAANECASFALRVTVERESGSAAVRPEDARRGFNNLFKQ